MHVPLPVTQDFFISSCLLLRHPSLFCSFNCLFLTFCLQENNITPCYWMGVLHVCVCVCRTCVQTPKGKWRYGCECLYLFSFMLCFLPIWTCQCVYVYTCEWVWWIGCVSFMAAPGLHASPTINLPATLHWPGLLSSTKHFGEQHLTRH